MQKMRERVVAAHDHVIAVDHLIQDAEVGDGEGRADTQPFCLTCGPGDRAAAEIGAENAVPVPSQSECLGADATGAVQDVHCRFGATADDLIQNIALLLHDRLPGTAPNEVVLVGEAVIELFDGWHRRVLAREPNDFPLD